MTGCYAIPALLKRRRPDQAGLPAAVARLLPAAALALLLATGPALAKNHPTTHESDNGGLFQPPAAIPKPSVLFDSVPQQIAEAKADAAAAGPAAVTASSSAPALPSTSTLPPGKALTTVKSIESMRLHSLFE